MSALLQNMLVFLLVAGAGAYAVWHYMPAAWRRATKRTLARMAVRVGLMPATSLQTSPPTESASNCSSGCGSCRGCD